MKTSKNILQNILTLDKIITESAMRCPSKVAFTFLNKSISYQSLEEKTNQLANHLVKNGVFKGDRIGILLPRCLEIPIAIYGILKAGGVFVPLDPNMPSSRLQHIVEDCHISYIISSQITHKKLEDLCQNVKHDIYTIGLQKLSIESSINNYTWDDIYSQEQTVPNVTILPSDLAYIIYTSGTTGTPKGIMHTHFSGMSYAQLSLQQYNVSAKDIIANHSPLHFDISTFGYLTSPLAMATTVIISDAHTKFPVSLAKLIKNEEITIWYSVPLALMQLSNLEITKSLEINSLRWVLYGGENYPPKKLIELMDLWPNASYSNVYGPAEVNQCTFYTIPKNINPASPIPLGTIWPQTDMLILDDLDQPVKKGEIGKLLIHSTTMMKGYWNNETLTKKSFYALSDIENKIEPKKFYRTGDLVKINADNLLVFYGRGDRQIKTRGYRVELDDVEFALLKIPEIEKAAVFAYRNPEFGKLIGANIILVSHAQMEGKNIQNLLTQYLPKYSIPEKINFVDSFKRTSAGKIDYKLLMVENDEL